MKIYESIMEDIQAKIQSGEFKSNEQLPPLRKIAEHYNTTPITARKSLSLLQEKGYIYVIDRKGFFVKELDSKKYKMMFHEQSSIKQYTSSKVEIIGYISPKIVADFFGVEFPEKSRCIKVCRVFYNKLLPVGIDYKYLLVSGNYLSMNNTEKLQHDIDLVINSYEIVKHLSISVMPDNSEIRELCFLAEKDPIYEIRTCYKTKDDRMVAFSVTYIPCEEVDLRMITD